MSSLAVQPIPSPALPVEETHLVVLTRAIARPEHRAGSAYLLGLFREGLLTRTSATPSKMQKEGIFEDLKNQTGPGYGTPERVLCALRGRMPAELKWIIYIPEPNVAISFRHFF
jgi:hypothetical protein